MADCNDCNELNTSITNTNSNHEKKNKSDPKNETKCDDKLLNANKSNASNSYLNNNSLKNGFILEEILNEKKLVFIQSIQMRFISYEILFLFKFIFLSFFLFNI
jgi:hypothetical protein